MVANEKLVEMVLLAQKGEQQGFTELYDTFHQDIYYYIYKIVKDEELAADLTQDTFVDILQKINTLREPSAFVTWSRQVAYSRCTAYFRKRKELLADEDEDGYSVFEVQEEDRREFIPDAALDLEELKAAIGAMCDALPEEQRAALLMRYFDELPVSQIAQIQGVSEGTVKSRLNYGRKSLRKAVEDYEKKNGVKLRCAGVVPLLLWLFAQNGKSGAGGIAATTAAGTSTAITGAAGTSTAATGAAGTSTAIASATGLTTKLIAGGLALALTAGGILGASLLRSEEEPVPVVETKAEEMIWSGFGYAETPVKNRHFQVTLTEFTEVHVAGTLEVTYRYEDFYSTDFTGTGEKEEDGTICYTLQCQTAVSGRTDNSAKLIYDPETQELVFDNIYFYNATMSRWPLKESQTISQDEQWEGVGECDICRKDDCQFVMEIYEMTDIAAWGKVTMYENGEMKQSTQFTARGYWEDGIVYYEALLDHPWVHARTTLSSFTMVYNSKEDTLAFYGMWYGSVLQRNIKNNK